ncbi:hypothetical protein GF325_13420 [Candidatus Bathyarchaeota archaeon]|nr:hypothetical protein [Candidatus Bathyarchaeota archaeon]
MDHLWVIHKETGTTLFYRNYTQMRLDPDLLSGLLSAFQNFSEVELNGLGVDSVNMGGLQWVYLNLVDPGMLLVTANGKRNNPEVVRERLKVISTMFIDQFDITPEFMNKKALHVSQFEPFIDTIDMLRDQWEQAEITMHAAELFDLMGIFQQIFNILGSIVQEKFSGDARKKIVFEIKEYSKKFDRLYDSEENAEFQKITFSEEDGWSVISLDPTKLDRFHLRKAFFLITSHVRMVLVENMGFSNTLNEFSRELIPFIVKSWELLEILEIIKPLLTILLERPSVPFNGSTHLHHAVEGHT